MQEKKNSKKKKLSAGKLPAVLIGLLAGGGAGYLATLALDRGGGLPETSPGGGLFLIVWIMLSLFLAFILEIILHELGHLLFGLWTGYRFCSFRVFSWMWIREAGRLRIKRFQLAGTAGQCLMGPPDNWETAPAALYHLGGVLMNLITAALAAGLWLLCRDLPYLRTFWVLTAVAGVLLAFTNGLPLKTGPVNNDGSNLREILRSRDARRAVWQQMKAAELSARGVRFRDMPEECFTVPEGADMSGSLIPAAAALRVTRLLDQGDLPGAEAESTRLLDAETGLIALQRTMLLCDRDFCRMVLRRGNTDLSELREKPQRQLLRQLAGNPSILRTRYAAALLCDRDEAAAARIRKDFDRLEGSYPYPAELSSERELMALADAAARD